MADGSNGVHDAYKSAYWIWRQTFFEPPGNIKLYGYIHKNTAVLTFDGRPKTDGGRPLTESNTECLCQLPLW